MLVSKGGAIKHSVFTKEYKLSLLVKEDVKIEDCGLFSLSGLQIIALIKAGVLPKDFISIARTPRGTRARINAIEAMVEEVSNTNINTDTDNEDTDNTTLTVSNINNVEDIEDVDNSDVEDDKLDTDEETGLPSVERIRRNLRNADFNGLDKIDPTSDNGKYIVTDTIDRWWGEYNDNEAFIEALKGYKGSKFYEYVINEFLAEYDEIINMKNPQGYSYEHQLYPYQKILARRLKNRNSYSLWLDMGGGKTFSAIYASRYCNLNNTLVVAPKSTLTESWFSSLYEIYPDSKVYAYLGDDINLEKEGNSKYNSWLKTNVKLIDYKQINDIPQEEHTYLLINYDKFSQIYANELVNSIYDWTADYVILDEVQNAKYRDSQGEASIRHSNLKYLLSELRKKNESLKTTALTGTLLQNELSEVRNVIELITGEPCEGIKNNRINIMNVSEANKAVVNNGFRYIPKINIKHTIKEIEIPCSVELENQIRALCNGKSYFADLQSLLSIEKAKYIAANNDIVDGEIFYLEHPYKNNALGEVKRLLETTIINGHYCRVGVCVGDTIDKHKAINDFIEGKYDVIVASRTIAEGVDGLQERSHTSSMLELPDTYARTSQFWKRTIRRRKKGSILKDTKVDIIIPQIVLMLNDGTEWSWDKSRLSGIRYKKGLGEAVMDGDIEQIFRVDWNRLYRSAMKRFKEGISNEIESIKEQIVVDPIVREQEEKERKMSLVNDTHRRAHTSHSSTMHEHFLKNRDEEINYHKARREGMKDWPEDPVTKVADIINSWPKRFNRIIDMGCGENKLKTLTTRFVQGVNHTNLGDSTVIEANMAHLEDFVKDAEFNVAVFCLSLWGCSWDDYNEYFEEAKRILDEEGRVIIVLTSDKFGENEQYGTVDEFIKNVEKEGFERIGIPEDRYGKIFFKFGKF